MGGSTALAKRTPRYRSDDTRYASQLQPVVITDNCHVGATTSTVSTVGTGRDNRTVGIAASRIQLVFMNNSTQTVGSQTELEGSTVSFNAGLEYNGVVYRVTFGGRTTCTLDPGGMVISDPLGIDVAVGDVLWPRTYLASGTAYVNRAAYSVGNGFVAASDLTAPGSGSVATSVTNMFVPSIIIGVPTPSASKPLAVVIQGDSMAKGTGDGSNGDTGGVLTTNSPWISSGGYLMGALSGQAGVMNMAIGSDRASYFSATVNRYHRMNAAQFARVAIIQYGHNDLNGYGNASQLQGYLLSIATNNKRHGIKATFIITVTPLVNTSTDMWATVGNQTTHVSAASRVTHNAWVRDGGPINPSTLAAVAAGTAGALRFGHPLHPIAGYFEVSDVVESSRDSGKWKAANRVVTDAAITTGTATLTSATGAFNSSLITAGDLGRGILVAGAGAAAAILQTFIAAVASGTSITTRNNASTTVSGATMVIGPATLDGTHPSADSHNLLRAAISIPALQAALA